VRLGEVVRVFARLGVRAFGGPAVHVALMRRELVERRQWLDADEFNRLFAACNLIPGPGSTQLALLLGRRRAGWAGMAAAAVLFITPAVAIMLVLAELYTRGGTGATVERMLLGVEAAVVGIVAAATIDLSRSGLRGLDLGVAAAVALGLGIAHVTPVAILAIGAVIAGTWRWPARRRVRPRGAGRAAGIAALGAPLHSAAAGTLVPLGLTFLKIGAIAFGSGYVLLPFLHADLVGGQFGCTDGQIADAFAAGQATPGPVFATAAFLGDLVAGLPGGLVAAAAIFAPSFLFVALLEPILRFVERSPAAGDALAGVSAAAVGLIGSVVVDLGRTAIVGVPEGLAAGVALLLLLRWPTAQPWAVAVGLVTGGLLAVT
jgi:chromate transporter